MGCEFHRDQKTIRWYGNFLKDYHAQDAAYRTIDPKTFGKCSHAITVPGAGYDIGVVPHPKNSDRWAIYYDAYGGNGRAIERIVGKGACRIKQKYAAARTRKVMKRQGWSVKEKQLTDGQIQLVCVKP